MMQSRPDGAAVRGQHDHAMPTDGTNDAVAAELRHAAPALAGAAGRGDVGSLPRGRGARVEVLRVSAEAWDEGATGVVPAAPLARPISNRYQRAAAKWPVFPRPSYEWFAALLTGLRDAGSVVRLAAIHFGFQLESGDGSGQATDAVDAALAGATGSSAAQSLERRP